MPLTVKEPVIYKLVCLYASRHRACICGPEAGAHDDLAYYGQILSMLKTAADEKNIDIVILGAMIFFAIERSGVALAAPTIFSGTDHFIHAISMLSAYRSHNNVQNFYMPVYDQFSVLFDFFRQHEPLRDRLRDNQLGEDAFPPPTVLPSKFESSEEAVDYWFRIIHARPICHCQTGSEWTPQCSAFRQKFDLIVEWNKVMQEYYLRCTDACDFETRKATFTLINEANLVIAGAGLVSAGTYAPKIDTS